VRRSASELRGRRGTPKRYVRALIARADSQFPANQEKEQGQGTVAGRTCDPAGAGFPKQQLPLTVPQGGTRGGHSPLAQAQIAQGIDFTRRMVNRHVHHAGVHCNWSSGTVAAGTLASTATRSGRPASHPDRHPLRAGRHASSAPAAMQPGFTTKQGEAVAALRNSNKRGPG